MANLGFLLALLGIAGATGSPEMATQTLQVETEVEVEVEGFLPAGTLSLTASSFHTGAGVVLPALKETTSIEIKAIFPSAQGYEHPYKYILDARPALPIFFGTGSTEENLGDWKLTVDGKPATTYADVPRDVWTILVFTPAAKISASIHLFERYNHQEFISTVVGGLCVVSKGNDQCWQLKDGSPLETVGSTFTTMTAKGMTALTFGGRPDKQGGMPKVNMTVATYGKCSECVKQQGAAPPTTTLTTKLYMPNYASLALGTIDTAVNHTAAGMSEMNRVVTRALASLSGVTAENVFMEEEGEDPPRIMVVRITVPERAASFVEAKWRRNLGSTALLSKLAGLGVTEPYVDWLEGPTSKDVDANKLAVPKGAVADRKGMPGFLPPAGTLAHPLSDTSSARVDINGCKVDAGFTWCAATEDCLQDWTGSDTGACPLCDIEGEKWCETLGRCLAAGGTTTCPPEEASQRRVPPVRVGVDDPYKCLARSGPGSVYCGVKGSCVQAWRGGVGYPCPSMDGDAKKDVPSTDTFRISQKFSYNVRSTFEIGVTVMRYNVSGELDLPVGRAQSATWHPGFEDEVRKSIAGLVDVPLREVTTGAANVSPLGKSTLIEFMFTTAKGYKDAAEKIKTLQDAIMTGEFLRALGETVSSPLPTFQGPITLSTNAQAFPCVSPTMMTDKDKRVFAKHLGQVTMVANVAIGQVYIKMPTPCPGECKVTLVPTVNFRFVDQDEALTFSKKVARTMFAVHPYLKPNSFEEMDPVGEITMAGTPEMFRESVVSYKSKEWQLGYTMFSTLRFADVAPIDFTPARKELIGVLLGEQLGAQTVVKAVERVGDPFSGPVEVDVETRVPDKGGRLQVAALKNAIEENVLEAKLGVTPRWKPRAAVVDYVQGENTRKASDIYEVPYECSTYGASKVNLLEEEALLQGDQEATEPTPPPFVLTPGVTDYVTITAALEVTDSLDNTGSVVNYLQARCLNDAFATALGRNPADSFITDETAPNIRPTIEGSTLLTIVFMRDAQPLVTKLGLDGAMKEANKRALSCRAFAGWMGKINRVSFVEGIKMRWSKMERLWAAPAATPYPLPSTTTGSFYDASDNLDASGHALTIPSPSPGPIISILNGGLMMMTLQVSTPGPFKPHALIFKRVLSSNVARLTLERFGKTMRDMESESLVTPPVLILSELFEKNEIEPKADTKTTLVLAMPLLADTYLDANHLANNFVSMLADNSMLPGFAFKTVMAKVPRFAFFNDTTYMARLNSTIQLSKDASVSLGGTKAADGIPGLVDEIKGAVAKVLKCPLEWVSVTRVEGAGTMTAFLGISAPLEFDETLARTLSESLLLGAKAITTEVFKKTTIYGKVTLSFTRPEVKMGIMPRSSVSGPQHVIFNGTEANPYYVNITVPESTGQGLMRGHQLPMDRRTKDRHYTVELKITRPVQVEVVPQRNPNLITSIY